MNANELIELLEKNAREINNPHLKEAATMLRQQDLHLEGQADVIRQQQAEIQTQYDRGFDAGCQHTKKVYEAEIERLKDEVAEWKMSYENCHRMCSGYGMN